MGDTNNSENRTGGMGAVYEASSPCLRQPEIGDQEIVFDAQTHNPAKGSCGELLPRI
jgi:hypothetical protein